MSDFRMTALATAIDSLKAERATLALRLDRIDTALASLQSLDAPARVTAPRRTSHPAPIAKRPGPKSASIPEATILDALRGRGGVPPKVLQGLLGHVSKETLRRRMGELMAAGKVIATGTRRSRCYALPGRGPAKEAP